MYTDLTVCNVLTESTDVWHLYTDPTRTIQVTEKVQVYGTCIQTPCNVLTENDEYDDEYDANDGACYAQFDLHVTPVVLNAHLDSSPLETLGSGLQII